MTQSRYVRVRFTPNGRLYTYRCRAARVGSLVVVPPSAWWPEPQCVRVAKLGHGWAYLGPTKRAELVSGR